MQVSGWFLLALISLAALLVAGGRRISARAVKRGGVAIDLRQIYEQQVAGLGVSWETYVGVTESVRDAYQIDARLLRLDDSLKKLFDVDSWNLGEGTETLNRLLKERLGVSALDGQPKTLGELLTLVERARKLSR